MATTLSICCLLADRIAASSMISYWHHTVCQCVGDAVHCGAQDWHKGLKIVYGLVASRALPIHFLTLLL